jgi:hypothetical protein
MGITLPPAHTGRQFREFIQFTTVGATTWTVPSGIACMLATLVGGGGGGGGGHGTTNGGGGGGGSGKVLYRILFRCTPGETLTLVVGAGGSAGTGGSGGTGGTGGATSIDRSGNVCVRAGGGNGGFGGTGSNGGNGGSSPGALYAATGGSGATAGAAGTIGNTQAGGIPQIYGYSTGGSGGGRVDQNSGPGRIWHQDTTFGTAAFDTGGCGGTNILMANQGAGTPVGGAPGAAGSTATDSPGCGGGGGGGTGTGAGAQGSAGIIILEF